MRPGCGAMVEVEAALCGLSSRRELAPEWMSAVAA